MDLHVLGANPRDPPPAPSLFVPHYCRQFGLGLRSAGGESLGVLRPVLRLRLQQRPFREQCSSLIAVYSGSVYGPSPCRSSLDDACTDLNETEHVGCQSFLDLHEDELVPRAKSLGDEAACLVIEVCTNEELSENQRMTRSGIVGEVDVRCASGVDRPVA